MPRSNPYYDIVRLLKDHELKSFLTAYLDSIGVHRAPSPTTIPLVPLSTQAHQKDLLSASQVCWLDPGNQANALQKYDCVALGIKVL